MIRRRQQLTQYMKTVLRSGGITSNIEVGYVHASRRSINKVYIARVVVNENVCENSTQLSTCSLMVGFTISLESVCIYNNCLFFVNNKVPCFRTSQIRCICWCWVVEVVLCMSSVPSLWLYSCLCITSWFGLTLPIRFGQEGRDQNVIVNAANQTSYINNTHLDVYLLFDWAFLCLLYSAF